MNFSVCRGRNQVLIHCACLFGLLCGFGSSFAAERTARQPNIVVVLTDDQGWGDLSLNGNTNLATPNIDQLASQGAMFDRFFVCPVCSPTRAEFLTGRYHPRSGVYSTSAGGERIDADERTIAETFREAGYATAAFGKWHNGMQPPYHPNARGFGTFYGFCSGHWGNYFSPPLESNGELVKGNGFVIDDFTEQAMEFITQHRDQPFFCYLPLNTPHSPMQVPDRWWNKFRNKKLEMHHRDPKRENLNHIRAALAMCENIDWNVGRLLAKLEELELVEDTIVVYFCDNGPNGSRWNGDMKGRKGSTDEGGVRSPLLIRWPEEIERDLKITQIGAAIDLLPTLASLAKIPVNVDRALDGIDLSPWLLDSSGREHADRVIYSHWNGKVSARTQRFRLGHEGALFDIAADPGQRIDVSDQHEEIAKRLKRSVAAWKKEVLADFRKQRPITLGHPDFVLTQIPARDGSPTGEIDRSNRFPNCSFFRNWTNVEDEITWDVVVGATGAYEVEMHYACPAADVGATIELSLGDEKIQAEISMAHDPPLAGQENDRVKRMESYVKDFRAMSLGRMNLKAGQMGRLTLGALAIPGSQALEFRLLMFRRITK